MSYIPKNHESIRLLYPSPIQHSEPNKPIILLYELNDNELVKAIGYVYNNLDKFNTKTLNTLIEECAYRHLNNQL